MVNNIQLVIKYLQISQKKKKKGTKILVEMVYST